MSSLSEAKTFADAWAITAERATGHKDISPVYLENLRRMYYAGAYAFMSLSDIIRMKHGKDDTGPEEFGKLMTEIVREFETFKSEP